MSDATIWNQDALAAAVAVYRPVVQVGGDPSKDALCRIALEEFISAHPGADANQADKAIREAAAA